MELYCLAPHRFPRFGRAAGLAIRENGRRLDAALDEQALTAH
jgi:hypothetical protein